MSRAVIVRFADGAPNPNERDASFFYRLLGENGDSLAAGDFCTPGLARQIGAEQGLVVSRWVRDAAGAPCERTPEPFAA